MTSTVSSSATGPGALCVDHKAEADPMTMVVKDKHNDSNKTAGVDDSTRTSATGTSTTSFTDTTSRTSENSSEQVLPLPVVDFDEQTFFSVPWAQADDPLVQAAYNFDDEAAFLEVAEGRRSKNNLSKADLYWDQCDKLYGQLSSGTVAHKRAVLAKLQSLQGSGIAKEIFQPTDFRLLSKLGQGGYGCVYKALHLSTGHIVALKELTGNTSDVELVHHRTLPWDCGVLPCYGTFRAVSHAGVALSELEEEEDHDKMTAVTTKETAALAKDKTKLKTWLILQFGKGGSLVDRLLGEKGALTEKEAARMLKQLTKTMLYLKNQHGIVHNDIKPANVLFLDSDDPGDVVICDFGAAAIGLWQKERLGGTFSYMPPEKLRARKLVGILTHYCNHEKHDVWALGVLLFASLYLKHPFNCKDLAKCTTITSSGDDAAKFYELMETNFETIQFPPTEPGVKPISPDLEELLQGMLRPYCLERTNLQKIKESSWVKRKGGKVVYPMGFLQIFSSCKGGDANHQQHRHHTEDLAVSKVLFESTINSLTAPSN